MNKAVHCREKNDRTHYQMFKKIYIYAYLALGASTSMNLNHTGNDCDLGCVHAYFAKAESAFWNSWDIFNADRKTPLKREYCSCFPREEDDFVSMHCALFEAMIVRAQVNRKGVYMTSFKRGYMWFKRSCMSTRISDFALTTIVNANFWA